MEDQNIQKIMEKFPDRVVTFKVESMNLKRESVQNEAGKEEKKIFISGLALPFGVASRNGILYREASVKEKAQSMIGRPCLFNHDMSRLPIGKMVEFYPEKDGMHYKAEIDSDEKELVKKIEKGYLQSVSISALVENAEFIEEEDKSFVAVDVSEFLEQSVVTIPGFQETTMSAVAESFNLNKKKKSEGSEDGSGDDETTMEEEISSLKAQVQEMTNFKAEAENRIGTLEARMDAFEEGTSQDDDDDDEDEDPKDDSDDEDEKKKKSQNLDESDPKQEESQDNSDDESEEEDKKSPGEDPKETEESASPEDTPEDPKEAYEKALKDENAPASKTKQTGHKADERVDLRDVSIKKKGY